MNNDFQNFVKAYFEYAQIKDIDIDTGISIFLTHVKTHNRPNTFKYYSSALSYINSYFKKQNIINFSQINTAILDAYVEFERNSGKSNNTINKRIGAIKTASLYLASNKNNFINTPILYEKLKVIPKEIDILSKDLILKIINYIKTESTRNKIIILLMLTTGIRRTECCHILKRNIDLNNSKIYLEHTKTNQPRNIFINDLLKKLIYIQLQTSDSIYLLSNNDIPLSPSTVDSIFHRMNKKGLTDKSISPHKLRHTFATTILKNNGGNIEEVRLLLGHSSYDMTKRYLHLLEDDLKATALKNNPLAILSK